MLVWIGTPETNGRKVLFLDRDGVINEDRPDYIKHWREFHFYPDALEALRLLRDRQFGIILISNQSALNRGFVSREDFWEIHDRMVQGIRQAGGDLLATFYCPHRPDEACSCRKPLPGMILAASKLFQIDPEDACMVGDRATDLAAAAGAGCRGILVDRSGSSDEPSVEISGDRSVTRYTTLLDAALALSHAAGLKA